jgi:methionine synthase II (cobalamin-independent)
MAIDTTNLTAYQDAMQALYNLLNQSYNAATSLDAEMAINDLADAVSDILTELNQDGIAQNTAQLQALQPGVNAVNASITAAKAQLSTWVKDVGIAGQIAGVMDKAVQLAGTIFTQ